MQSTGPVRPAAFSHSPSMPINVSPALRSLRRNPGFFAVATLTLAVGLGPTTAVFSVFKSLMLQPLPVESPHELAVLGPGAIGIFSRSDMPQTETFSYEQYRSLSQDNHGVLEAVAATPTFESRVYWGGLGHGSGELLRASCQLVTGAYFPMLGVLPLHGRLLAPEDDGAPGSNPVAVVSHDFWNTSLGADPSVVGSAIRLHGLPYTVVGVAMPPFRGHTLESSIDIWVPMSMQEQITLSPSRLQRSFPVETYWLNILMRLRPEVGLDRAEAAVNARLQEIFVEHLGAGISAETRKDLERIRIPLTPLSHGLSRLRRAAERPLMLLWGATGLVLLVACANLGGLLLVRASGRREEFWLRMALGAGRLDRMKPVLAESMVLAGTGAAAGYSLAFWLAPLIQRWLQSVRGAGAAGVLEIRPSHPELLFAAAAGTVTVLACGLVPAMLGARASSASGLRTGQAGVSADRDEVRARSLLVGAQLALAVVLLFTAGLFLKNLGELRSADLGLEAATVIGIRLDPQGGGFSRESQPAMRRRIVDRIERVPGVQSAAFTGSLPLSGNVGMRTTSIAGYVPTEDEEMSVIQVWASPGYFDTLGIRLLAGRFPNRGEANVVVVNNAFADRYFAEGTALGGIIDGDNRVVGIVRNVRQIDVRADPPPLLYKSTTGYEGFLQTLAVRLTLPSADIVRRVREAVREVTPGMPVDREYSSVELLLERGIALERMLAMLVAAFSGVALLLCAVGLFGVCSQIVRNRTGEIGLRLALGATRGQVQALVVRRAAILLGLGAAVGTAGAVAAGRLIAGVLFEVGPFDWRVLAWALSALTVCACLAATLPAVRAGHLTPSEALRHG